MFAFFHAQLKEHETQVQVNKCFGRTLFAHHHPQGGLRFWKQRKLIQMEAFGITPWFTLTGPRLAYSYGTSFNCTQFVNDLV
jgi:hypothetical protein